MRDLEKADWLVKDLFKDNVANGTFRLVEVKDMAADNAFDAALQGVSGIVHAASDTTFGSDPNLVVPPTVAGVKKLLHAAAKEETVKRFVLISSIAAAGAPLPGLKWHLDQNSWNDWAIEQAWAPPPYENRGGQVYSAAKAEAEKAMWTFMRDEKPNFVANAILPFILIGPVLHEKQNASTASMIFAIHNGAKNFHLPTEISKYEAGSGKFKGLDG